MNEIIQIKNSTGESVNEVRIGWNFFKRIKNPISYFEELSDNGIQSVIISLPNKPVGGDYTNISA